MSHNGKEEKENMNAARHLQVVPSSAPDNENGKVKNTPPKRLKNAERRSREYFTPDEVESLIAAAKKRGRHGFRDAAMVLVAYRHGLRVSELVGLQWPAVGLENQQLHVSRLKNGRPGVHPLLGDEIRILRRLKTLANGSAFVFTSERGGRLSARTVRYMIAEAGKAAGLINAHPHQLRHATGYKLANDDCNTRTIQDYLGHKSIVHTVRYTELNSSRFEGLFGTW
jgi:integrase